MGGAGGAGIPQGAETTAEKSSGRSARGESIVALWDHHQPTPKTPHNPQPNPQTPNDVFAGLVARNERREPKLEVLHANFLPHSAPRREGLNICLLDDVPSPHAVAEAQADGEGLDTHLRVFDAHEKRDGRRSGRNRRARRRQEGELDKLGHRRLKKG